MKNRTELERKRSQAARTRDTVTCMRSEEDQVVLFRSHFCDCSSNYRSLAKPFRTEHSVALHAQTFYLCPCCSL
ncbi:uncharacterized protein C8R40DRAFT_504061 [Lentinula edodes]|uniref:uncharacterized protein n=1 Tax=Lentinula edodes TaxID=5353 RepID=UPI001E8D49AB|nr:uncharacterized protein C8R40DRAFT_504061 [Lentinula edodes]KAH7872114.1 hypothetical protein C8R40DRAFT_504061 [Lentinula edodes]